MCHYSQTDPSAGSRRICQFLCVYVHFGVHLHAYKWAWKPIQQSAFVVRRILHALGCVYFGECARFAAMCVQASTVVACVRKQRQTASVSLSASCSSDWCGRKHSDGCRGTSHPWKTNWMIGSVFWRTNKRQYKCLFESYFIWSNINIGFGCNPWHVYNLMLIYYNEVIIFTFSLLFWFLFSCSSHILLRCAS